MSTPDDLEKILDANQALRELYDAGLVGRSFVASATITSAQLKDLIANPVQLAPTSGPGRRYGVVSWFLTFHHGSTPYTYATGGPRTILMVGPRDVVVNNQSAWELFDGSLNAVFADNVDVVTQFTIQGNSISENIEPQYGRNQPLVFGNAGTVDLSVGNGTLDVGVVYAVLNF